MKNWKPFIVKSSQPIFDAIKVLNNYVQFAVVVNDEGKLLGTITDGDIRRGILNGFDINKNLVTEIMNRSPVHASKGISKAQFYKDTKNIDPKITLIPLIDDTGVVTGIMSLGLEAEETNSSIPVVIMAGGLGSRLGDMTKSCPKPLLKINGVPILEIILMNLKRYNFKKFFISVNYMSEMIEDYFKHGEAQEIDITYIRETKKMGTAGCLSLVNFENDYIIVMNGDVLTQVNFQGLLDFHISNNSSATMCVRDYSYTIPFGVVSNTDGRITKIEEKPSASVFVNAGIYVLNKSVLKHIPKDEYFDMPSLFKILSESPDDNPMVYPVHEYWADVGHKDDFLKAQEDLMNQTEKDKI